MPTKTKSIFLSSTFWAVILLMLQALLPVLSKALEDGRVDLQEGFGIAELVVTTSIAIIGRYRAREDLYTPNWLPGRNRE